MIHYEIPQRLSLKQTQQQHSQYKHISIECIYEIIQPLLHETGWCLCACLMCCCCVVVPVTGHNVELHVKQDVQAECVAMLSDHVTEEDTETFRRVQEVAAQVRKLWKG